MSSSKQVVPDIKRSGLREIKTNPLTDGEALYAKNLPEVFYNKAANSDERYIIEEFFKKNPPIENFPHDINYQIATQKAIIENQMGRSIDMMGVGVDQAISLLTRQANKLVRTKYYTTSLSKYVYIDASVQHWFTKEVVTYELPALHDDFVLGIANHRYGQAKTTLVEPMFSMKDMNIYSWKKHCNWTDEEVKTYDAAGVYRRLLGSLLDLKQVALKANCDLGFQKFLMLGHPDAPEYKSFMSYVTMSADVFPTTLIPDKPFSQMHTGEIEKWCASVLNQYKLNTKQIMLPNRLLLPPSEFIALGMSGSPQISARSKAEIIMGFFKNVRSDFQIEECIYLAKEYNNLGKTYGVLYNKDRNNLFVNTPLVPTWSPLEWLNGYGNMQRVLRFRFSDLFCAIPETFMGFQIPEGDGTYGGGDLGVIIKNPKEIGQKDDKTKEPKGEAPTINEADLIAKVEAKLEAKIRAKIDAEFRAKAKKEAEDKAKKEAEDKAKKEAEINK